MNIPIIMSSAQPHRIYGQINTELTWYAKPVKARYRSRLGEGRWYPSWTHTIVKYYGPYPVRYPDIAEQLFDDHEDEEPPERWKHDPETGHTAKSIWRASKINVSWETMTPGALLKANADMMREKAGRDTASITIDDETRTGRQYIILQIINAIKLGYLRADHGSWERSHIYQQLHAFSRNRAMDPWNSEYAYQTPTMEEINEALEMEANISPRKKTLNLQDIISRYPQYFQNRDEEDDD